ncbi:hypothetical protein C7S20_05520 [Christiangramia fulva]|uniref:Uncharacterized protein n=1 Tax=Christiangramia fulva TaxID=2126553 RepID=A0A2R3Z3C2_9FLAO|nr:hypothetical protein [Christiangramia fulva]AVR44767.1 hypothetical protein C7S20_05520 [Christiangramia fulva]
MEETEKILYREDPSEEFQRYVYIGSAYPEDMNNSHPQFESFKDWQELVDSDEYAENLVNLFFCEYIFYQDPESFEDYFGAEFHKIYKEKHEEIIASGWFRGLDTPVFSGLDLRDREIEESTYFENGEYKRRIFTEGSEVEILREKYGFSTG